MEEHQQLCLAGMDNIFVLGDAFINGVDDFFRVGQAAAGSSHKRLIGHYAW